jgi:hypothetical protein
MGFVYQMMQFQDERLCVAVCGEFFLGLVLANYLPTYRSLLQLWKT